MFREFKKQPRLAMAFSHEFCTLIILENISRTWIIYLMFEECFVCAIAGGFLPFCSSSHCQIRKTKVCGAVVRHVLAATLTKDGFIKKGRPNYFKDRSINYSSNLFISQLSVPLCIPVQYARGLAHKSKTHE